MNIKACLLVFAIIIFARANAQDKIYKKNGDIIDAKVKTVNGTTINYKRINNPDGPDYTILKRDVRKIVYKNGTSDVFDESGKNENVRSGGAKSKKGSPVKSKYGDNILSVIPAVFTGELGGLMNDPGVGISYERLLDRGGHISFILPVVLSFASGKDYTNQVYTAPNIDYGTHNSVMFMPGVKFYPAPGNIRFRYDIGVSFFAVLGSEPYVVYDNGYTNPGPSSYNPVNVNYNYTIYGVMFTNGISLMVTKHLYFSMDLAGGVPFSDNRQRDHSFLDNPAPLIQFAFKVGARF